MKTSAKFLTVFGVVAIFSSLIIPLSSYAEEEHEISGAVTVSFGIAETLSMEVIGDSHIEEGGEMKTVLSVENGSIATVEHGINVATNNAHGYQLSMKDSDDNNNLTREDGEYNIPAVTNLIGEDDKIEGVDLVEGQSGWGYDVKQPVAEPEYSGKYLAVPVGDWAVIYNHNEGDPTKATINVSSFSEVTYVKFGISAGNSRAGVYEDTIEYQAVGNLVPDHLLVD